VRAPDPKPWLLNQSEIVILKNSICKGASDKELEFCLAVARRYELDPFRREIHFVRRWDSQAEQSDGKKGGYVYVPVVGIDGLLHIAARDHADFGSFSEVEYGPMIEVTYRDRGEGATKKLMVPEWARIEAWKKGAIHPTIAKVWWEEIYPDIDRAPLVRRMKRLMLGKCAKAQVTRTSYPKTGGLLIPEEMQAREFQQITPEGRIYTVEATEPENKFLSAYEQREQEQLQKLTPAQREVVERKMRESKGGDAHQPGPNVRASSVAGATHPAEQHAQVSPVKHEAPAKEVDAPKEQGPASASVKPIAYYIWHPASETATILPPTFDIGGELKAILKKLVRQGHVAPNAKELEGLKREFQIRGFSLERHKG
jgi:hypothetical protein